MYNTRIMICLMQESFLKELGWFWKTEKCRQKTIMTCILEENRVLITRVEAEENRLKGK